MKQTTISYKNNYLNVPIQPVLPFYITIFSSLYYVTKMVKKKKKKKNQDSNECILIIG